MDSGELEMELGTVMQCRVPADGGGGTARDHPGLIDGPIPVSHPLGT